MLHHYDIIITSHSLKCSNLVLVAEVLCVIGMEGMCTYSFTVAMVINNIGGAIELQFQELGKRQAE